MLFKEKESVAKGYILLNLIYMTLGKRQILRKERSSVEGERLSIKEQCEEIFEGEGAVMYRTVLDILLYAFIKIHRTHTSKTEF